MNVNKGQGVRTQRLIRLKLRVRVFGAGEKGRQAAKPKFQQVVAVVYFGPRRSVETNPIASRVMLHRYYQAVITE